MRWLARLWAWPVVLSLSSCPPATWAARRSPARRVVMVAAVPRHVLHELCHAMSGASEFEEALTKALGKVVSRRIKGRQ